MKPLLYLTNDGALEPLGFSQVYRVVEGLGRRGHRYILLSLERDRDLRQVQRVAELDARLQSAGVTWVRERFDDAGGARAAARNVATLTQRTLMLAARGLRGIHARGYICGMAANTACRLFRVPYLFDARGYWIDERIDERQWFTTPARERVGRLIERRLYADAVATVSLTRLQADDIASGRFGDNRGRPAMCIPTCADFDDFLLKSTERVQLVPQHLRDRLAGRLVLGMVGSINASYLTDAMLLLARKVLDRRHDAVLLVLSAQREAFAQRIAASGIAPSRAVLERADHRAMPGWLALIDWGLQLLAPERPAKRGSMPTKLAEFLATGVRPVHYGCNIEVNEWVRRTGSGLVLERVDDAALDAAADAIAAHKSDAVSLLRARAVSAPHFSLASGIERYDQLLRLAFAP